MDTVELRSEPTTRVYIDSSSPVSLFRMDNRGDVKTVCMSPCGDDLPVRGLYWASGKDINPSDKFQLPIGKAETKLQVSGGSKSAVTAGIVLALIGGNVILWVGIPALFLTWALAETSDPVLVPRNLGGAWAATAAINGVGLALGVVGLVLWISNSSSSVAFSRNQRSVPRYAGTPWMGGF